MEYVKIDHIFNYVSAPVRQMFSDDDQIKSWVMQAVRTLSDPRVQYIKDIYFTTVTNHKGTLPPAGKKIISTRVFQDTYGASECFDSLCAGIELPSYDSFASPCPIPAKLFLESTFYASYWSPVIHVGNLSEDYLCKVINESCEHVYSTKPGSDIVTFSFCEGEVAFEYYKNITDDTGAFLLPREPEKLWFYLGAYCSYMYWKFQYDLGKDGALQRKREYQQEMAALRGDAKAALMFGNISLNMHRHLTFDEMRLGKLPSYQQRLQNWRANV